MNKHFAWQYPRNSQGWIDFPDRHHDVVLRKELRFPEDVRNHPAKANIRVVRSIIEYVSESGDTILDPMAGTGTILLASLEYEMSVIAIELEKPYYDLICQFRDEQVIPNVFVANGDCSRILPLPCDHVIFSPPYSVALKKAPSTSEKDLARAGVAFIGDISAYSKSPGNVGNLNEFMHNQTMEKVYRLLYESIRPGGSMTVILKDFISGGKRVLLSERCKKQCRIAGFELWEHYKRSSMGGMFVNINRSKGLPTIDDEDIIMFRKETNE